MSFFTRLFSFFWFIIVFQHILFWLYLWQLKEYHIGRFVDHFRTTKGKKLLFNFLPILKVALLILLLVNASFFTVIFPILLFIYLLEFVILCRHLIKRTVKKPVFTLKALLLLVVSFVGTGIYWYWMSGTISDFWFIISLLLFNILIGILVSGVVLLWQPLFVLGRKRILARASEKISGAKNLKVIGITGSYGKTSTKEFLKTILSEKYNVLATRDHQNSEMGIAKCILNELTDDHRIFIVEMGAYNKGGIKLLCDIVRPTIGVVTGVNEQHLSVFGSLENLLSAEGGQELLSSLPKNGTLIVNGDNAHCLDLYKKARTSKKIYTVRNNRVNSDIWTEDIVVNKESLSFIAMSKDKELSHIDANVLGKHNIENLLGAMLVAKELGMNLASIAAGAKDIIQKQAGITLEKGKYGIHIIDSSYSSNPNGVSADLDYVHIFGAKKVIVMPCLIELGTKSSEIHYLLGRKIAHICDLAIITTKDKFKELQQGATEEGMPENKMVFCENAMEISAIITTFCKEGDAVLLEGRVPKNLINLLI
jgi:UDP-N-acetylmuramoyl-tripeptide--D-alanyl-D-alanine ligase